MVLVGTRWDCLRPLPVQFKSLLLRQLGASDISLAPSFFTSLQSSSCAHSAAPRFQTGPAVAGLRFGAAAARRFCLPLKNINFDRPFHVGAKSALLRRLFVPEAKKTSSVPSLLRLPGCGPLRWIRSRLAEQQQIASILTKAPGTAVVPGAFRPLPAPVLLPPLIAGTAEQPAAPSAAPQSLYSRATPCPPGTPPPAWRPPAACIGGAVLGLT